MQLHNTSQYAIRVLIYISKNGQESLLSAKELSKVLIIPYKFLTKIMAELVKAELIVSIKGREGGYKLNKEQKEIRILDILNIFNECEHDHMCVLGIGVCDCTNKCALHDQWTIPRDMIKNMYADTTLDKLTAEDYKM